MEKNKTCYNCIYKRSIPGNAHIACAFNWSNESNDPPKSNEHGRRNGWYMFPFNFDPVWQEEECKEFSILK